MGQYIASADQSTAKEIAAIKSGTEPNVVIGQDPSALPLLAESGKVVDLSAALKTQTAELTPASSLPCSTRARNSASRSAAWATTCCSTTRRTSPAAGITAPPATWAQLEADAVKLSDPAKHQYGIYIPFGTDEWISYDWESVLWSNGGQLVSSDGTKTAFDSPAGVSALTLWTDLVRKDHAAPATSYAQAGSYDGAPAFASNAVAMIVEGQWAVSEFKNVDYGVAELPAGSSGHSATGIGIGVASVFDHGTARTTRRSRSSSGFLPPRRAPSSPASTAASPAGQASSPTPPSSRRKPGADLLGVRRPAEHRADPADHPRLHGDLDGPGDRDQRRAHRRHQPRGSACEGRRRGRPGDRQRFLKTRVPSARRRARHWGTAYSFVLPVLGLTVLFSVIPLVMVIQRSLYKGNIFGTDLTFAGLANYADVFAAAEVTPSS